MVAIRIRQGLPGNAEPEDPEDSGLDEGIVFDRNNVASIRQAEALIKARFGLLNAPPLCSEPELGWTQRLSNWIGLGANRSLR